jgi:hypothetical protein
MAVTRVSFPAGPLVTAIALDLQVFDLQVFDCKALIAKVLIARSNCKALVARPSTAVSPHLSLDHPLRF